VPEMLQPPIYQQVAGNQCVWTADCPFVDSDPQALLWSVDKGFALKRYGRRCIYC